MPCSATRQANQPLLLVVMSILTIIRQRRHRRSQIRSSTQQRSQRVALGFGFVISAALVLAVLAAVLAYAGLTSSLPPIEELSVLLNPDNGQLLQPTRLYDRTGQNLLAVLAPSDGTRIYALFKRNSTNFGRCHRGPGTTEFLVIAWIRGQWLAGFPKRIPPWHSSWYPIYYWETRQHRRCAASMSASWPGR